MNAIPPDATDASRTVTQWVTRTEAAALLRVSVHTFDRYRRDGRIKRYTTPGAHPRFKRAEVLALIQRQAESDLEAS